MFNDGISRVKDSLGRTVILFQLDGHSMRIILLKIDDVAYIGTTPGINTLVRITDNTDIFHFAASIFVSRY